MALSVTQWIITGFFGAILVAVVIWVIKAFIDKAKADPLPAEKMNPTWEVLVKHCKREHGIIEKTIMTEVKHYRQIIKTELERGEARFKELNQTNKEQNKILTDINFTLGLLKQRVEESLKANGAKGEPSV